VFSGNPESRKKLVSLAHLITKNNGVQMCVKIEKVDITKNYKMCNSFIYSNCEYIIFFEDIALTKTKENMP